MRYKFCLFLLSLLLLSNLGVCFGGEHSPAQFTYGKGKIFTLTTKTDANIILTVNGSEYEMTQSIGMDMNYEITDVAPDGTAIFAVTFTGVRYKQDSPLSQVDYDSARKTNESSPYMAGFEALAGCGFQVRIDNKGSICDIQGKDAMIDRMVQKTKAKGPNAEKLRTDFQKQFSDQALKSYLKQSKLRYPDHSVTAGESWADTFTLSNVFPIALSNSYKLLERKNGRSVVAVLSQIQPNEDAEPVYLGSMQLKFKLGGEQRGTVEILDALGFVCKGTLNQNLSGVVSTTGSRGEEKTWPVRINSIITMEGAEVN